MKVKREKPVASLKTCLSSTAAALPSSHLPPPSIAIFQCNHHISLPSIAIFQFSGSACRVQAVEIGVVANPPTPPRAHSSLYAPPSPLPHILYTYMYVRIHYSLSLLPVNETLVKQLSNALHSTGLHDVGFKQVGECARRSTAYLCTVLLEGTLMSRCNNGARLMC